MNKLFDSYRSFIKEHASAVPIIDRIPLTEKQNRYQYVGGQFYKDRLYAVVNSAEKMLIYRPKENIMEFTGQFASSDFKWTGGCIYKEKIYFFPRLADGILVYHPSDGTFEKFNCAFPYNGEHHYGGVCTRDGIVYQPPRNSDHLLKWDLNTGSCTQLTLTPGMPQRYCGSLLHPNGFLYLIPETNAPWLKMNLQTEEVFSLTGPDIGMTFDPVIAADGHIYGFRSGCDRAGYGIIKIDTSTDEVSVLYRDTFFGAYGTKCGINGKLYSFPGYTGDIWEWDPASGDPNVIHTLSDSCEVHYAGGAADTNGTLYAFPVHADTILRIRFIPNETVGPDAADASGPAAAYVTPYKAIIPSDLFEAFFCDFY